MASYKHQCHEVNCGRAFDTPGKLNRHSKVHSKPFRCSACDRGFALRLDLGRHVKARHRLGHQRHACSVVSCHYSSARKDNLRQHEKKQHGKVSQQERSGALHIPVGRSAPQLSDDGTNPIEYDHGTNDPSWRCATFLQAATAGNLAIVEAGLNMGIDVNFTADDLSSALHCAARAGKTPIVEFLLKKGAHVDARNRNHMSPLQEAILSQNSETVKMLLLHGSQLDNVQVTETCIAQSGSVKILQACMAHDRRDEFKYNVFNAASRLGQYALMTALLETEEKRLGEFDPHHVPLDRGGQLLAGPASSWAWRTNTAQFTPMHHAAANGHVRGLQILIENRFDINIKGFHKVTPLHLAARIGGAKVVAFLLGQKNIKANCKDLYGLTPLHYAIEKGNIQVVRLLLKHLQSNSDDFEYPQSMVLPFAAGSSHPEVVDLLSQKNINYNYLYSQTRSPLQLSAIRGYWEIAQALLDQEDANRGLDAQFQSSERDQIVPLEVVMRLLKHQDFQDINVVAERGNVSLPGDSMRFVKWFDYSGLLHIAVFQADCSILRVLLGHEKIDVNLPTRYGMHNTPLHLAISYGKTQAAELLLQHGRINPNSTKWQGETCLQLAISHGQADIAKLLIQHDKTDVNLSSRGSTPLEMATEKGFDELVELILARQALDLTSSTLPSASTHYLPAEPAVVRSHIEEHTERDVDIAPSSFLDEYMDEYMDEDMYDASEYMLN